MVFLTFRNVYQKEGEINKQTQQMGQKNVIEDLRSMEPQTNGTNWSEEGHKGNQVSVMK